MCEMYNASHFFWQKRKARIEERTQQTEKAEIAKSRDCTMLLTRTAIRVDQQQGPDLRYLRWAIRRGVIFWFGLVCLVNH